MNAISEMCELCLKKAKTLYNIYCHSCGQHNNLYIFLTHVVRLLFRYGQLSGLVEPVAGVLGALLVTYMEPILPYSLGFAAGAMVYVVIDDIVPEAQTCGNGKLASWGGIIGFVVMMCLDVGLG